MTIEKSSFRDNSGFIFYESGEVFRAINNSYRENFEFLVSSGLYDHLLKENLIIPHSEADFTGKSDPNIFKIIKPEKIDFISYPYEWCFTQLKDAALTTIKIQREALHFGMTLKDSSAYNIQFREGKPVLIDTLSFEIYEENKPWAAYNQFCKHFLAPLVLAAYCDIRLNQLLKNYIDGIPLDLAKNILGYKLIFRPGIYLHIGVHSNFQSKYSDEDKKISINSKLINKSSLLRLADNLELTIEKLKANKNRTEWSEYYSETHSKSYYKIKKEIVESYIEKAAPGIIRDLGANEGEFSKLAAADHKIKVTSFDSDSACIEKLYNYVKEQNVKNISPFIIDLSNPSPSVGWANSERNAFIQRLSSEKNNTLIMALALIHHLSISNSVPLNLSAEFFSKICNYLIIEFIPKSDPMVEKLLLHRKDIFSKYNPENFETEFRKYFSILDKRKAADTERVIYLMKNNN